MREKLVLAALVLSVISCGVPPGQAAPSGDSFPATQVAPAITPSLAPEGVPGEIAAAPALTGLRMLDESNGWGVTETSLLRTDDGGLTWHDRTPPGLATIGYAATTFFLDGSHAWLLLADPGNVMLAGTLYRTADAGLAWDSHSVSFGGGEMVFLDDSNGWMMAQMGVAAGSNAVSIWQTGDGGASWVMNYINDPTFPGAWDSLPLGGLKQGLTAIDMQTAWIGGVTYAMGMVYLFRTTDAGHHWEAVPLPVPSGRGQDEFDTAGPLFVGPEDAFLPMHVHTVDGPQLDLYVSHDRGRSWSLQSGLPHGGSLDFVSPTDGIFWDGKEFHVTHDGGRTWDIVHPDVAFGENFAALDFVSPGTGWVLTNDVTGHHALYKTTDGGASWVLLGEG